MRDVSYKIDVYPDTAFYMLYPKESTKLYELFSFFFTLIRSCQFSTENLLRSRESRSVRFPISISADLNSQKKNNVGYP